MKTLTLFLNFGFMIDPDAPDPTDFILVADYLTIAAGVLGIVSIIIIGIQYLTASSHSPKIRKSKRHLFEIIIGLVAYAVIYAILRWILLIFSN